MPCRLDNLAVSVVVRIEHTLVPARSRQLLGTTSIVLPLTPSSLSIYHEKDNVIVGIWHASNAEEVKNCIT